MTDPTPEQLHVAALKVLGWENTGSEGWIAPGKGGVGIGIEYLFDGVQDSYWVAQVEEKVLDLSEFAWYLYYNEMTFHVHPEGTLIPKYEWFRLFRQAKPLDCLRALHKIGKLEVEG